MKQQLVFCDLFDEEIVFDVPMDGFFDVSVCDLVERGEWWVVWLYGFGSFDKYEDVIDLSIFWNVAKGVRTYGERFAVYANLACSRNVELGGSWVDVEEGFLSSACDVHEFDVVSEGFRFSFDCEEVPYKQFVLD